MGRYIPQPKPMWSTLSFDNDDHDGDNDHDDDDSDDHHDDDPCLDHSPIPNDDDDDNLRRT